MNLAKCQFARSEVPFLGHLVSAEGIRMDPRKVAAIVEMDLPGDLTQLRSFLGAASQYRKFVKDYSKIARPLSDLLKKCLDLKKQIQGEGCKVAFQQLKDALVDDTILAHPDFGKKIYTVL